MRTVFSGQRIAAVSAMKCTPQKTIDVGVRARGFVREPERVADEVGDVLHLGHLVVVGEDDRVALRARARGSPRASCVISAVSSCQLQRDVE